ELGIRQPSSPSKVVQRLGTLGNGLQQDHREWDLTGLAHMSTDACELDGKLAARPSQPGTQSLLDPGRNVAQLLGVNGCDYETNQSAGMSRRPEWARPKTRLPDDPPH